MCKLVNVPMRNVPEGFKYFVINYYERIIYDFGECEQGDDDGECELYMAFAECTSKFLQRQMTRMRGRRREEVDRT